MLLSVIVHSYRWLLQPIPPFTWIGSPVSLFDVGAALRLCIVLRQLREMGIRHYQKSERARKADAYGSGKEVENASLVKSIAVTLVVVYGGEAIMSMSLNFQTTKTLQLTKNNQIHGWVFRHRSCSPRSFLLSTLRYRRS